MRLAIGPEFPNAPPKGELFLIGAVGRMRCGLQAMTR
jgi:hypothetical protein